MHSINFSQNIDSYNLKTNFTSVAVSGNTLLRYHKTLATAGKVNP